MTSELSTSPLKFRFIKSSFWLLLVLIIAVAWYVDQVNYRRLVAMEKSRATEEVNVYRTKIEGVLTKNVQLVRGLGIALADKPRFHNFALSNWQDPYSRPVKYSEILVQPQICGLIMSIHYRVMKKP